MNWIVLILAILFGWATPGHAASLCYSQTVDIDQVCGYWRLGEPSGATAYNSSPWTPSGNLTISSVSAYGVAGIPGSQGNTAMSFNGSSDYISDVGGSFDHCYGSSIPYPAEPCDSWPSSVLRDFTAEVWFKPSSLAHNGPIFTQTLPPSGAGTSNQWSWSLIYTSSGNVASIVYNDGTGGPYIETGIGTHTMTVGNWYYIVMTVKASTHTLNLYFNGVLDATSNTVLTGSCGGNTSIITIGAYKYVPDAAKQYAEGTIDEAAVYGYVLDGTQITNHYTLGSSSTACTGGDWPTTVKRHLPGPMLVQFLREGTH